MRDEAPTLTADLLLHAYRQGIFPMSEGSNDPEIFWVEPKRRGIIPIDGFHISRSLARRLRREDYRVSFDTAFSDVVRGCADRSETWINQTIFGLSCELHERGSAHSVEVWQGNRLIGGTYGIAIKSAFFAESMFSYERDASKVALAYLLDTLGRGGFTLLDTQFLTPHLASLGGIEVSRSDYRMRLVEALDEDATFDASYVPSGQDVVQRNAHTS